MKPLFIDPQGDGSHTNLKTSYNIVQMERQDVNGAQELVTDGAPCGFWCTMAYHGWNSGIAMERHVAFGAQWSEVAESLVKITCTGITDKGRFV